MYLFCVSELLILREKKCFANFKRPLEDQKKIEKILSRRGAQKRYTFAPDATNYTFFIHPVYILIYIEVSLSNLYKPREEIIMGQLNGFKVYRLDVGHMLGIATPPLEPHSILRCSKPMGLTLNLNQFSSGPFFLNATPL